MNAFDVFKPAPYLEEIQDQVLVKKNYRYWRLRTFYSMYIGYALYYFTRSRFVYAMPAMQIELGMSKVQLGMLCSILSLAYGVSKFLSGILGDKSNPRYFMSIGLILTGVFNLLFGMSSFFWAFALFLGVEWLVSGVGMARLRKITDALVFSKREGEMVDNLEHLPQYWGRPHSDFSGSLR